MNKLQIDCFMAASITGSLTRAAKELYMTPQVVSKHIRNLENELGILLFQRSNNGMELTDQGIHFYEHALRWSEEYNSTLRRIDEYYADIASSLSIGISEYVNIIGEISKGIASFRDRHRNIMMTGQQYKNRILLEEVEQGHLDVAIMNEQQIFSGGSFEVLPFAKEDLRLYISGYKDTGIKPDLHSPEFISACRNLPHISSSYGVWERSNWEEISHRVTSFFGYDYIRHYEAVNFRSVILNLNNIPCSAVSDARFGYVPKDTDILNIPLNVESHLCCLWHKKNENPLIMEFAEHMKQFYTKTEPV